MSDLHELQIETAQRLLSREELIRENGCENWPAVWKNLLPVTARRKVFMEVMAAVEKLMAENVAWYLAEQASPWSKVGSAARLISNEGMEPANLVALGLSLKRMLGMPSPVKGGAGPDGVLYADHPEVKEAEANRMRTAEWVAHEEEREAMATYKAANEAWGMAANADEPDAAEVARLEKIQADAEAAHAAAKKKFNQLFANPRKGLQLVRD